MLKILILYYSGVGNTQMVAKEIYSNLKSKCDVTILSIENPLSHSSIENYDALIIGFPTIHCTPAKPIMNFMEGLKALPSPVPTFLFTTCGLYSANTLRIFSKNCIKKNVIPVLNRSYRCAATDGILIAPFMNFWFKNEKNLKAKIETDVVCFVNELKNNIKPNIPHLKWYGFLNYPNKLLGQLASPKIYVHKSKCIRCYKCIQYCPVTCYLKDSDGYPTFLHTNCLHCYRCIHNCPVLALSLSKHHTPPKTLYYSE